jgi:hypothetical protein
MAAAKLSQESDEYLNWQKNRSDVREKSNKGQYLRSSLQTLNNNDDVLLMLESLVKTTKIRYRIGDSSANGNTISRLLIFIKLFYMSL